MSSPHDDDQTRNPAPLAGGTARLSECIAPPTGMLMCLIEPERLRNPNTGLLPSSPPLLPPPIARPLPTLSPSSVHLPDRPDTPWSRRAILASPQHRRRPLSFPSSGTLDNCLHRLHKLPPELPSRHRRQQLAPAIPTARASDPSEIHKQNRTHAVAGSHERMVACLSHPKIEHVGCLRSNLRRRHNS